MNILITGLTGFVGKHLAKEVIDNSNSNIFGTSYGSNNSDDLDKGITILHGDLRDKEFVSQVITESKPEVIYHLAALSSGKDSFHQASEVVLNNLRVQLNIFDEVLKQKLDSKILIIGSAEEYGNVSDEKIPIDEQVSLNPISPYGLSKVAQDLSALTYFHSFGLKVIRLRSFNHTGPGQINKFVVPAFAKQIVNPETKVIKVGNLEAVRDFTDVRDVVKAYRLASEKCEIGEVYNIGSGSGYKIQWILEKMIELSKRDIEVQVDKDLLRPADIPVTICNCEKFIKKTGWEIQIPIEKTLEDILNYWRNKI